MVRAARVALGLGLRNGIAHEVGVDQRRMHIVFAAHDARVAQTLGNGVDRREDIAVGLALARRRAAPAQLARGEHRAAPRAEVLADDLAPRDGPALRALNRHWHSSTLRGCRRRLSSAAAPSPLQMTVGVAALARPYSGTLDDLTTPGLTG